MVVRLARDSTLRRGPDGARFKPVHRKDGKARGAVRSGIRTASSPAAAAGRRSTLFILSCIRVSTLRRASAWAATIRSSRISFSAGLSSESSICTPLSSPLPVSFTVTRPPPAVPSTSLALELGLHRLHLRFEFGGLLHQAQEIGHRTPRLNRSDRRRGSSSHHRNRRRPAAVPSACRRDRRRQRRRLVGARARRRSRARKARQHRLHQRIGAHAGLELGLARRRSATSASAAPAPRDTTTIQRRPVHCVKLAGEIVDQRLRGARLERDLEPAVLAAHQPHVAFERGLDPRGRASRSRARSAPRSC